MREVAPTTDADPGPEPRLSYVIARLERAVRRGIGELVRPYGLTTLQYTTLSVLGRRGELSNAQLARRAYMTPQAMSEVIAALEQKGLIERSPSATHRRVYPAVLTARGREVLRECDAAVDELERTMLAGLTPRRAQALREWLIEAVRALRAGFPGP